jgi:hypothetical protein
MIDWISVNDRLPKDREFVLVACPSGYITTPYVFRTARIDKEYRGDSWITEGNDRLTEYGLVPTHWTFNLNIPE